MKLPWYVWPTVAPIAFMLLSAFILYLRWKAL